MALINCTECGHRISDKASNCVRCGAPVVKKEIFKCFECGHEIEKGINTCQECGAEQDQAPKAEVNVEEKITRQIEEPKVEVKDFTEPLKQDIAKETKEGFKKEEPKVEEEKHEPKKEKEYVYVAPAPSKKWGCGKWVAIFLFIALIIAIAFIYLSQQGYNNRSMLNLPSTVDLSVACPYENVLFTSAVDLTVTNNGSRTHNGVTIRLTAYDKNDNIIKQKNVVFERTLEPYSSLSKPATLPAKTRRCDCVVESSNPY